MTSPHERAMRRAAIRIARQEIDAAHLVGFWRGLAVGAMLTAACLMPGTSQAAPAVGDKQLHAAAGAGIAITATAVTGSGWRGFAWGCGANVAKELADAAGMGVYDPKDIAWGCLGAAVGAGTGRIFITPRDRGAVVGFSLKFN